MEFLWNPELVTPLQKNLYYFAFVGLEKALDRVHWKVLWWAMRKTGIEE
jgi:hypothetical protein